MKKDTVDIQSLIDKNESLQNTIDSLNIQRKIDAIAIKFDGQSKVIAEVSSYYEASWNKLIWFVVVLGSILAFLIPYLMGVIERKQIKAMKEGFETRITELESEMEEKMVKTSDGYLLYSTLLQFVPNPSSNSLIPLLSSLESIQKHDNLENLINEEIFIHILEEIQKILATDSTLSIKMEMYIPMLYSIASMMETDKCTNLITKIITTSDTK